jgi:hypothetical protein
LQSCYRMQMPVVHGLKNQSDFPRVYRASGGWLIFLTLIGAGFAIAGSIGSWWFAVYEPLQGSHSRFWLVGLCASFAALGVYCLLSSYRSRVVLYSDRIEVEELTRTDVLSREEIRGWRSLPTSPPGFVFVPKEPTRRSLKVAQVFRPDPAFAEWVHTLPCLDTIDHKLSKAEIRNNVQLGTTPGERMKALKKGRRIALAVNSGASLVSLWGFLYPEPYELAILSLVALPWIAAGIVRGSRGLFRVDGYRNDAHPNVAIAILFPTLALFLLLRSVFDYEMLHALILVWYAIGIGFILWLSVCAVDLSIRTKGGTVVALLAFSLVYGYGAAVQANALLDRSPEASYSAQVKDKRVVSGKTTTYQLDLAPWGPVTDANRMRVGRTTYEYIQPGDVVHLVVRKGALGASWHFMRSWERGSRPKT